MGLTYFKRYRMEFDLTRPLFPVWEMPVGYRFRPWDDALLAAHAETKYRCFRYELDASVFPSLGHIDGCRRLMQEITRQEAFVREATWLLEYGDPAKNRPEFCGTIQGMLSRKGIGSVQNVGIVPEHRGRGLGTLLLRKSLEGFCEAGLKRVSLEVTAKNAGARRLYRRLGFRMVRTVYKTAEVAHA
ncbi:MAG: GNAT family N-acetyltransferase [Planctomycetes bacterium]|nr:GNAT family N-acetyltransferase [Planctomycetota bacterium]MBL7040453.1 GNAT family N-acetyltransferase [Pirellulaceae bacterium]